MTSPRTTPHRPLGPRLLDRIARIGHEVNRAYCQELGEEAHPQWTAILGSERALVRKAAEGVLNGTFATLEDQHEAWRQARVDAGWTWGNAKDVEHKISPALVPWADLPASQRAKSAIFRQVCVEALQLFMEPES